MAKKTAPIIDNPFPGLRPFRFDEAHLFFGREGQTDEVLWKLSENKFVGVIGPSGAGKSSFVFCGVIPMLYGGYISKEGEEWEVIVARPGGDPIMNLGKALLAKDKDYRESDGEGRKLKQKIMQTFLKSSSGSLSEAVSTLKSRRKKNFLVLIDQFEELFRFKDSSSKYSSQETYQFVELLMDAIDDPVSPVHVAITMRSEFIGHCSQYPELTRKINDSHFLIPQLTREQKKKVIEGPVSVGGGKISQALVQRLLNDIGEQRDQLPVLQHALMRTWDYWMKTRKADEPMEIKHYEAIGTMKEALSIHADDAFKELNEEQKRICESMFKALTEKKGAFGIRRPTTVHEIAKLAGVKDNQVVEIVEKFREPGRSLLTPPITVTLRGHSIIDISHESLMRIWKRLRTWVEEEAESVNMYLRMADAAEKYQEGLSGLWRPPDLQLALNWQLKNRPSLEWGIRYNPAYERTMSFLEYSKKDFDNEEKMKELRAQRQKKARQFFIGFLASATVIAIAFLVYALTQKTQAETNFAEAVIQTEIAQENLRRADSAFDAMRAANIVAEMQRNRAIAAKDTAELERLEAQRQERIAKFQTFLADSAKDVAVEQTIIARDAEDSAKRSAQIALAAQIEEEKQRVAAEQREKINLAKALGVKAAGRVPDTQLKGLLARQAYVLNSNNEGDPYDPDVYAGLYASMAVYNDPIVANVPWSGNEEIKSAETDYVRGITYIAGTRGQIMSLTMTGEQPQMRKIADMRTIERVSEIDAIAISPDGNTLAAGGKFAELASDPKTELEIINLNNNSVKKLQGLDHTVRSMSFSDNGSLFVLDNKGHSIKRVNTSSNSFQSFMESPEELTRIHTSKDGRLLAGGYETGKISIWRTSDGSLQKEINTGVREEVYSVRFSRDGKWLAVGYSEGELVLIEVATWNPLYVLTDHTAAVSDIKFDSSPSNNRFLVTSSFDKLPRMWDLTEPTNAPVILGSSNFLFYSIEFTPDNRFVVAGSIRGRINKYPASPDQMGTKICTHINRNMTDEEWENYVGSQYPWEATCNELTSSTND